MVLCPTHHRFTILNAMPVEEQRRHKAAPYNLRQGVAEGPLRVFQSELIVHLGGVYMAGEGSLIEVDDVPLLQLHMGQERTLELSLTLYNENDELLALIERNDWIIGDPFPWDFEFGIRWMTVRERHGLVAITIDARKPPIKILGHIWHKGQHFRINERHVVINGVVGKVGLVGLGLVAMKLRADTHTGNLELASNHASGGKIVSQPPEKIMEHTMREWQRTSRPMWPWNALS